MATSYKNADGLVTYFGPRGVENERVRVVSGPGPWVTLMCDFEYDNLPGGVDGDLGKVAIPANSFIKEAHIQTRTAIAGSTPTLTVGLEQSDGTTAIDADGIDAAIAASALSSTNEVVICDGALVGALVGIGANDGYVVATTGGTVSAGAFTLVLTYLPPVSYDSF